MVMIKRSRGWIIHLEGTMHDMHAFYATDHSSSAWRVRANNIRTLNSATVRSKGLKRMWLKWKTEVVVRCRPQLEWYSMHVCMQFPKLPPKAMFRRSVKFISLSSSLFLPFVGWTNAIKNSLYLHFYLVIFDHHTYPINRKYCILRKMAFHSTLKNQSFAN